MTLTDQKLLKEVREEIDALASRLKIAHDKGFTVSFAIDNSRGMVANFEVRERIDLDATFN